MPTVIQKDLEHFKGLRDSSLRAELLQGRHGDRNLEMKESGTGFTERNGQELDRMLDATTATGAMMTALVDELVGSGRQGPLASAMQGFNGVPVQVLEHLGSTDEIYQRSPAVDDEGELTFMMNSDGRIMKRTRGLSGSNVQDVLFLGKTKGGGLGFFVEYNSKEFPGRTNIRAATEGEKTNISATDVYGQFLHAAHAIEKAPTI